MEEKKNYFKNISDFEYSQAFQDYGKKWIKSSQKIMNIVWWLNMSCAWANAHFNENRQAEVLKECILKIKDYLERTDLHYKFTENDFKYLKNLYSGANKNFIKNYRKILLGIV